MDFLSGLGDMASGALKGAKKAEKLHKKMAKHEKEKHHKQATHTQPQVGYSTASPYSNNAAGAAGCYHGYCPPPQANHNQPYPVNYPPPAGYQPTSYQQQLQQTPYPPGTNPHSAGPVYQSPPGGAYPQQPTGYPPAPAPGYPPAPYPPASQGSYPAHQPR